MIELSAEFDISARQSAPLRSYVVCSTPRSGSTLLCRLLAGTSSMGLPMEYFNPHLHLKLLRKRFATRQLAVVARRIMAVRCSSNGCFGFKAHYDQFAQINRHQSAGTLFPDLKFVYITRTDVLAQAVSYSKALQSGVWSSEAGIPRESHYSEQHLLSCLSYIMGRNRMWETFFILLGIEPCRVTYEELCANTRQCIDAICRFVGVEAATASFIDEVPVRLQRDEESRAWAERLGQAFDAKRFFEHFRISNLPPVPPSPDKE